MKPNVKLSRQAVADYRAAALSAGRYDLLAMEYTYPLTIYVGGEAKVITQPEDTVRFYAGFHSAMKEQGLHSLTGKVTAEDLPRNGRFRIWTEWYGVCAAGTRRMVAATVCYCTTLSDIVATEMVEFDRLALPVVLI